MYILGLNVGHDATAVLIRDGEVLAGVAEERMTRVKYHFGFPYEAVAECLRIGGVSAGQVDLVAFGFDSLLDGPANLDHVIMVEESGSIDPSNETGTTHRLRVLRNKLERNVAPQRTAREMMQQALDRCGLGAAKMRAYDHHTCHAASAYFDFGHEDCLLVTADGAGDGLSASVTKASKGSFERLHSVSDKHSVGRVYSAVTKLMGFKRNRHEGKVTGLAALGDANKLKHIFARYIQVVDGGADIVSPMWRDTSELEKRLISLEAFVLGNYHHGAHPMLMRALRKECGDAKREDIAAAVQAVAEDVMRDYVRFYVKKTGLTRVGLAGGIFANVRVNQEVLEIPEVEEIFVHPNMGDGGVAAGAAYMGWNDHLKTEGRYFQPRRITNVYYGAAYTDDEIEAALKEAGVQYERPDDFAAEVARLVADGKIVGHFNGGMEYGPRALGSRTILASATDRTINDWLNERLGRTEFMPFAPVCMEEHAHEIFERYEPGAYPGNFMTITFDVKPEWRDRIPAVTHVDNTARPQTITREQHAPYYDILKAYHGLTGLPIVINTSFNRHEEPIVRTPTEAIASLEDDCVDVLAIGSFIARV